MDRNISQIKYFFLSSVYEPKIEFIGTFQSECISLMVNYIGSNANPLLLMSTKTTFYRKSIILQNLKLLHRIQLHWDLLYSVQCLYCIAVV